MTEPNKIPLQPIAAQYSGWRMLLLKEILRFWRVVLQTVGAPILTAVLYLLIFGNVLSNKSAVGHSNISYLAFLAPGLIMMSVLQNSFANSSSSLIQSKITGNLVFIQISPLSHWHWYIGYVGASVTRGLLVGTGVYLVTLFYDASHIHSAFWTLVFLFLGAVLMASLGLIAGLWAEKFDQLALFQNFVVVPMTFLAGVFYSINKLPKTWQIVSRFNPFFYMIDGLRYGFLGVSDASPWFALAIAGTTCLAVSILTLYLLKIGYKLKT